MHGYSDHKIYIQPLGFLRGCCASHSVKVGQAKWLGGGVLAFSILRIIYRQAGVRQKEDMVLVSDLNQYMGDLDRAEQDVISVLLMKISASRQAMTLGQHKKLDWSRPLIQGVVNVTPDSFSDGGQYNKLDEAVGHAHDLVSQGADIIDIGGESTRPGADKVSVAEELDRVIPVIEKLSAITVPISIDTRNADVMEAALRAGADMINDVSALSHDDNALNVMARSNCPIILMHAQNNPDIMQNNPQYDDVVLDVYDYLEKRISVCKKHGINQNRLIVDVGIGFGKTVHHNIALMANLSLFHGLGVPLLLGVSRKSFIGHITGEKKPSERLAGSLALGQMAYDQAIQILRVHDVTETVQSRAVWCAITD